MSRKDMYLFLVSLTTFISLMIFGFSAAILYPTEAWLSTSLKLMLYFLPGSASIAAIFTVFAWATIDVFPVLKKHFRKDLAKAVKKEDQMISWWKNKKEHSQHGACAE